MKVLISLASRGAPVLGLKSSTAASLWSAGGFSRTCRERKAKRGREGKRARKEDVEVREGEKEERRES